MQPAFYVFSGTGNSLWAARRMAHHLGEGRIEGMAHYRDAKVVKPDSLVVGLFFPLYVMGLPLLVEEFIARLDLSDVEYVFAVMTSGPVLSRAMTDLRKLLKSKGEWLASGFRLKVVNNYIALFKIPPLDEQKHIFAQADQKLKTAAKQVRDRLHSVETTSWPVRIPGLITHPIWKRHVRAADRKFTVSDACTSCGLCAQVCPVDNIKLVDGKPRWLHHCEECLACLHFCPPEAIDFGPKTLGKTRYHHAEVSANDLIALK
ncbi:MAG: EFR1 family ferrodoxin [Candidatus Cloacimonetes bacterium]|nr:EFR1 family ferrodoxin [Candidatus Cloacimonadota bacterium]